MKNSFGVVVVRGLRVSEPNSGFGGVCNGSSLGDFAEVATGVWVKFFLE